MDPPNEQKLVEFPGRLRQHIFVLLLPSESGVSDRP